MSTSVYVHFPYCLQKCPYCDFASGAIKRHEVPHEAYADAVIAELDMRAPSVAGRRLSTVFFGGGTPSLWRADTIGRVIDSIKTRFASIDDDVEITAECNPSSLDRDVARALREVGVNRISIGVQSLNDERLKFLGRLHSSEGALQAVSEAKLEMPRVSADMMFGAPGQTAETFVEELTRLMALDLDHVSVYALTVEPATQFGALHKKGKLKLASEGDYANTFLATRAHLGTRGLEHYEVSNYARVGQTSRHNQHYWRGGEYLGLGAGAVGCVHDTSGRARRYRNEANPERYMAGSATPSVEVFEETLNADDLIREALMLGLRTREGMNVSTVEARTNKPVLIGREAAVERQLKRGNLIVDNDTWHVPHDKWLSLDSIVADLF
jgi:putative oxygen-independent coproporphyrinogen III oxidase